MADVNTVLKVFIEKEIKRRNDLLEKLILEIYERLDTCSAEAFETANPFLMAEIGHIQAIIKEANLI